MTTTVPAFVRHLSPSLSTSRHHGSEHRLPWRNHRPTLGPRSLPLSSVRFSKKNPTDLLYEISAGPTDLLYFGRTFPKIAIFSLPGIKTASVPTRGCSYSKKKILARSAIYSMEDRPARNRGCFTLFCGPRKGSFWGPDLLYPGQSLGVVTGGLAGRRQRRCRCSHHCHQSGPPPRPSFVGAQKWKNKKFR